MIIILDLIFKEGFCVYLGPSFHFSFYFYQLRSSIVLYITDVFWSEKQKGESINTDFRGLLTEFDNPKCNFLQK